MVKPSIKQLTYLIALEEERSFSRAAERCNVTQSTMSAAISELEVILGQKIINRTARSLTFSPLGEDIVKKARVITSEIDQMMANTRVANAPLSGTFRIGIIPTIAPYVLPVLLPSLQAQYPELKLQLAEDLTKNGLEKLRQGKLDAVLMAFPYDTADFETEILGEEPFLLAAPASKPQPQTVSANCIDPQDLLLLEDGHCLRDHVISACHLKAADKFAGFSAVSLSTVIEMVKGGFGVTLLPKMATQCLPHSIRLVPFEFPAPVRKIGLAWLKNSPAQHDIEAFCAVFKALPLGLKP